MAIHGIINIILCIITLIVTMYYGARYFAGNDINFAFACRIIGLLLIITAFSTFYFNKNYEQENTTKVEQKITLKSQMFKLEKPN